MPLKNPSQTPFNAVIQKRKWFLSSLSLIMLACVLISSWEQAAYAKGDYHEVNWESLELSSQQREDLSELDDQWRQSVQELVPKIRTNERKLKRLMQSSQTDEDQILNLQQEIHDDKSKLKLQATQIFLMKRKILNKNQQGKLMKMMKMH